MGLSRELSSFFTLLVDKVKFLETQLKEVKRKLTDLERVNPKLARNPALTSVPGSFLTTKPQLCIISAISGNLATCIPIIDDPNRTTASNLNADSANTISGVWVKDGVVNDLVLVFYVGIHDDGQGVFLRSFVGVKLTGSGIQKARVQTITATSFTAKLVLSDGSLDTQTLTVQTFNYNMLALTSAFPYVQVGNDIPIITINDTWYCLIGFNGFEVCP